MPLPVGVLVLVVLGSPGALAADELGDAEGKGGPIAQLQAMGIHFECKRLRGLDSAGGSIDPREVTDDENVEYVRLGRTRDSPGELRPLPEEVFDILPQFPKLRAVHIELHFRRIRV